MKILYIHQYFNTPKQAGSTRSYWISKELTKNGHNVTMLTARYNVDSNSKITNIDGIKVIYLNVSYDSGTMNVPQRLWAFLKFVFKTIPVVFNQKNVDLVIATSTPLTVGIPALLLKWIKKTPYVFEVRDLWPEVPIQMGGLQNKLAIRLALWLEKAIYKNALHIVALSPGMYDGVVKREIPEKKVSMIPNMSKIDEFWPREKDLSLIKKLGLKTDTFKIVYFGAMGIANGMNYIIDAARILKDREGIEFILLGYGSARPEIEKRCKDEGIKNVNFYDAFPMAELSKIVNLCDVSLVTFANIPILATNSPNKLFDSLSAGKPIILNSPGWTKDLVSRHNCGFFVDPEVPKDMADKIVYLKENPTHCEVMGKNARLLAEGKYDKSILSREFATIIDSLEIDWQ